MKKYLVLFLLFGCSTPEQPSDPMEGMNRGIHSFNRVVEKNVMRPVAKGYNYITPEFVQEGILNFFANLSTPWTFINDLLQGEFRHAGESLYRFTVNTTFGLGGLIDVAASQADVKGHKEDIGQTLAVWGVGEGPYITVPFLYPMPLRDAFGFAGDVLLDPTYEVPPFSDMTFAQRFAVLGVGGVLVNYADNVDQVEALDKMAMDHYATTLSVLRQKRQYEIDNGWDEKKKEEKEDSSEEKPKANYDIEMNFDDEE